MTSSIPTSSGIYRITCTSNGKFYIGSAVNLRNRWTHHRNDLDNNNHHNLKLQRAWKKYGEQSFTFEIIEFVLIPECLLEREQYWIDTMKPFFNIATIAGSRLGLKHTSEARAKVSAIKLGKSNYKIIGRKHTPEALARMSAAQRGKTVSSEARANMSKAKLGKKQSEEHIHNAAESHRGMKHSLETREKIGRAQRGKIISPETRARMSEADKRRPPASPETREKRRIAGIGRVNSPESIEKTRRANLGSKRSPEACEHISASRLKHVLIVTSPDGSVYVIRSGLTRFCKEHGISASNLAKVANGLYNNTKGWKACYETNPG